MLRLRIAGFCLVFGLIIFSSFACSEEDQIYKKCENHPRGPWCYQEAVEQLNEPSLCENILKYWPKARGVHGWCYYQLALRYKDCALCDSIQEADIRKMCKLDVCK